MGQTGKSGGLQEQWGLSEPRNRDSASDEQASRFRAAFNAAVQSVNSALQYTAAHAEREQHALADQQRQQVYSAYQSVASKIDATDSARAERDVSRVLGAVEGLKSKAAALKQGAETALNAWLAKESEYDAAAAKVIEMAEWGHEKAETLSQVTDAIQGHANDRKYDASVKALDSFLPKLTSIYEDYQTQRAAQQEFEAELPQVETKLVEAGEVAFAELQSAKDELTNIAANMREADSERNFVRALECQNQALDKAAQLESEAALLEQREAEATAAAERESTHQGDGAAPVAARTTVAVKSDEADDQQSVEQDEGNMLGGVSELVDWFGDQASTAKNFGSEIIDAGEQYMAENPEARGAYLAAQFTANWKGSGGMLDRVAGAASDAVSWAGDTAGDAAGAVAGAVGDVKDNVHAGMKYGAALAQKGAAAANEGIDWAQDNLAAGARRAADAVDDVPIVGDAADAVAWGVDKTTQVWSGALMGATSAAGDVAAMVANPYDAAKGFYELAKKAPRGPLPNGLKLLEGAYDAAFNGGDFGEALNDALNPVESMKDSSEWMTEAASLMLEDYAAAAGDDGDWGQSLGKFSFDLVGFATGATEARMGMKMGGKGSPGRGSTGDLSNMGDATKAVDEATDVARAGDKTSDSNRAASAEGDGTRSADSGEEASRSGGSSSDGGGGEAPPSDGGNGGGEAPPSDGGIGGGEPPPSGGDDAPSSGGGSGEGPSPGGLNRQQRRQNQGLSRNPSPAEVSEWIREEQEIAARLQEWNNSEFGDVLRDSLEEFGNEDRPAMTRRRENRIPVKGVVAELQKTAEGRRILAREYSEIVEAIERREWLKKEIKYARYLERSRERYIAPEEIPYEELEE